MALESLPGITGGMPPITFLSFFFSRARRRLERKKKKRVYTSFEQVAQRKHSWVDVDLEWNAAQIFPFEAFFIVFFFLVRFSALYNYLTRLNERHLVCSRGFPVCG